MRKLVTALALMDDRGRSDGQDSRMLWEAEWKELRRLLLAALHDVKQLYGRTGMSTNWAEVFDGEPREFTEQEFHDAGYYNL
jgi:hypothetical protein